MVERFLPALAQTSLADAIFGSPAPDCGQLPEGALELAQSALERGRWVRLPHREQSQQFLDRSCVRHHQIE